MFAARVDRADAVRVLLAKRGADASATSKVIDLAGRQPDPEDAPAGDSRTGRTRGARRGEPPAGRAARPRRRRHRGRGRQTAGVDRNYSYNELSASRAA